MTNKGCILLYGNEQNDKLGQSRQILTRVYSDSRLVCPPIYGHNYTDEHVHEPPVTGLQLHHYIKLPTPIYRPLIYVIVDAMYESLPYSAWGLDPVKEYLTCSLAPRIQLILLPRNSNSSILSGFP